METKDGTRRVRTAIEIGAPVEVVWNALTDPQELVNWFPLQAQVTPGEGGNLFISWGQDLQANCRIEVWKPNRHLRTGWFEPSGDATSHHSRGLVVDYKLESRGGKTFLRLVHSGFGTGSEWDEEYDGVDRGWQYELRSLRHYLERKRGSKRNVAWARQAVDLSVAEAWERLWSREGLLAEGEMPGAREGDRYDFTMATGDRLEGRTLVLPKPREFAGTVENMDDAVFRTAIEDCGRGLETMLWLSSWNMSKARVGEIEARWAELLRGIMQ